MRKITVLTLCTVLGVLHGTSGALALGPESSWTEIRSTPDVRPQAPMLFFGVHAISLLDLCVRGDRLRAATSDGPAETPLRSTARSYEIRVDRLVLVDGGHSYNRYLFTKRFDIPACA